jgi:hypothetical protein
MGPDPPVEAQGPDHDGDDHEDRDVRQRKERDAFHEFWIDGPRTKRPL